MHKDWALQTRTATMMDMYLYEFLTNRAVAEFHDREQSCGIEGVYANQCDLSSICSVWPSFYLSRPMSTISLCWLDFLPIRGFVPATLWPASIRERPSYLW